MKCKEFRDLISEFLDGEMVISIRDEFLIHLLSCEECKKEFSVYLKENIMLRKFLQDVDPPSGMLLSVINMITKGKINKEE